jgi:RNA polymerase sigma-70 factor (ECF subfamily)
MSASVITLSRFMNLDEDIELVRSVKTGDPCSFGTLVDRYSGFVFGVIRSMIFDPNVEEDIAQETFIQVFRNIGRFREDSQFKTWLYRITYNQCLSHLRKKKRNNCDPYLVETDNLVDTCACPEAIHQRNELKDILSSIIKQLPPQHRAILHLYYYEGIQYDEISEMTGLPIGTVKSHLFRAKERVRHELKTGGWIEGDDPCGK